MSSASLAGMFDILSKAIIAAPDNVMETEVEIDLATQAAADGDGEESSFAGNKPSRERLQALERGLETLSFLNRFGAATSTQVAKALRLKRSTAHRILAVLVNLGLLRHDALNHQFILCSCVGELSSGFRDDPWVSAAAVPLMKAWTHEHQWPLVLTTPLAGRLVVRASTDYESPMSVDRFHCGQVIPVRGSTAGLIYLAYSQECAQAMATAKGRAPATAKGRAPAPAEGPGTASAEELSRIRAAGYVARPTACFTGGRISVPLTSDEPFAGCITMRARAENLEVIGEVHAWVASLQSLASQVQGAISRPNA